MLIGLTGRSGSGKSTVCRLFGREGYEIIDCDEIVHGLYRMPVYCAKIAEIFGKDCVKDGAVDRSALSAIVFSDPEKLALLNTIASSFIKKAILCEVERVRAEKIDAVLDAPLLFEYELHRVTDCTVAVICDTETAVARLLRRDTKSEKEIRARLLSQKDDKFFREHADILIENNGGREELVFAFSRALETLRARQ